MHRRGFLSGLIVGGLAGMYCAKLLTDNRTRVVRVSKRFTNGAEKGVDTIMDTAHDIADTVQRIIK